jgi:hypothetical protein
VPRLERASLAFLVRALLASDARRGHAGVGRQVKPARALRKNATGGRAQGPVETLLSLVFARLGDFYLCYSLQDLFRNHIRNH